MHRDNKVYKELSETLLYLYNTGKCYNAYRNFGAHIIDGGVQFTVWAPEVTSVKVVGDFNNWGRGGNSLTDENGSPLSDDDFYLELLGNTGVYTGFIPGIGAGALYKYDIEYKDGRHVLKADPFAFEAEKRPDTGSVVCDLTYKWHDSRWLKKREANAGVNGPMNIYEVHLGSWRRHPLGHESHLTENNDGFYTYDELAESLIPYVKGMGYNYIELLPVAEHPLDASWGYQVTGYYAATSRFGHPTGLMNLIDKCHKANIGVIIDWVPGHFCPDEQGLMNFNGGYLYESDVHPEWGTYKFDFAKSEVRSFLLSNAMFWLEKYHIDGIRVDGVTSMLFLNFGVTDESKKRFNKYGDDGNLDAIEFLKEFNHMVGTTFPGVVTCAEESTAWPLVTAPPDVGGLGFHYKWNMGWMNDSLKYMKTDFIYRPYEHNKLTFSMCYAFSENYILPYSHDEVVHGKLSLIGRMPGDIGQQFAGLRLLAMYQMTHPGKKLSFMCGDIAQFIEWREYEELEWFLLGYDNHAKHNHYISKLNKLYLKHKALWEVDNSWDGFDWIDPDNSDQGILSYMRYSRKPEEGSDDKQEAILAVLNFNVHQLEKFRVGVPHPGKYKEFINTNAEEFGGNGLVNKRAVRAKKIPMHGREWSIEIAVPSLGGALFQWIPDKAK